MPVIRLASAASLFALSAGVLAADPPIPPKGGTSSAEEKLAVPPAAIRFSVSAQGGCEIPLAPTGGAGFLSGGTTGVKMVYEQCVVHADFVPMWLSPCEKKAKAAVEWASVMAGPSGPSPDRVLIDTRASHLPLVGFRGIMRPQAVRMVRRPLDPALPKQVTYDLHLDLVGDFTGLMRGGKDGKDWIPLAGWAEHIQAVIVADLVDGEPSDYLLRELRFFGREPDAAKSRRSTILMRLVKPLTDAKPMAKEDPMVMGWQSSQTHTIYFNAKGEVIYSLPGNFLEMGGDHDLLGVPHKRKSQPVLTPPGK